MLQLGRNTGFVIDYHHPLSLGGNQTLLQVQLQMAAIPAADYSAPSNTTTTDATKSRPRLTQREVDDLVAGAVARLDADRVRLDHWRHEELTIADGWLPKRLTDALHAEVEALQSRLVRKRLFTYKNSGSISYRALYNHAPTVRALYESEPLLAWMSDLAEQQLLTCPPRDAHSCAVYQYEHEGDKCGYHTDNSWYHGARYTVLIGLEDHSSARLHCRVHLADQFRPTKEMHVATTPGTFVFFNGDKLVHGVTPLGAGERRVVLSMQYVTDRRMGTLKRIINDLKDSLTYFGGFEIFLAPAEEPIRLANRKS